MDLVNQMRQSRGSAASLKALLSTLRSKIPDRAIVALEGKDDVPVFESWIGRSSESFEWEPFVSNGKRNSIALRNLLIRDTTDLSRNVFFIVDHDYDGLGDSPAGQDIYVLPGYSIENFLATASGLDSVLKGTFGLHSKPDLRALAIDFFNRNFAIYCNHLLEPCGILWAARKSGAKGVEAKDAVIDYFNFSAAGISARNDRQIAELIRLEENLDPEQMLEGKAELSRKDLSLWIRGKYVYAFFQKCCQILHGDLNSESPQIFSERVRVGFEAGSISLARLAGVGQAPIGLREAVQSWESR
ncbi:DUF4435 domain-containing protein [Stenotrophomonas geniculata]